MGRIVFFLGLAAFLSFVSPALAQDRVWVQIEAQPTLREGEDRARAYSATFADVNGFQLRSGWYAIVLGPYDVAEGAARLVALRRENLIPRDSFVADGRAFEEPFWPVGAMQPDPAPPADPLPEAAATPVQPLAPVDETALPPAGEPAPPAPEVAAIAPEPVPVVPAVVDETPAEARRSEAALTRPDREALQTALQWFGFYSAAVDGAFGPGTRGSMAAWQEANGFEPTGVLTTLQRDNLLAAYRLAQAELGLDTVTEEEAGIRLSLPLSLVQFDRYDPPFVHYAEKAGSGVQVTLISQPGDQGALFGLYDILQTLEIMPTEGDRSRGERSFTLSGRNAERVSHAYAELKGGLIKGYILTWKPADDARMARVLAAMQASFEFVGDRALDPGLVPMDAAARRGLLSGLEIRRPALSRSGFYIDASGTVLTTTEAVDGCDRITIDRDIDADLTLRDDPLGIAVLTPKSRLAPPHVAGFLAGPERIGSDVAVAGYSYEDTLSAPVLSFGTLEDTKGLDGEAGVQRLALTVLPGDAGGPVLDGTGAVLGMLLPRATGADRQLPADVAFAAAATALTARLREAGLTPAAAQGAGALAPEDLSKLAIGMTALVSCWK